MVKFWSSCRNHVIWIGKEKVAFEDSVFTTDNPDIISGIKKDKMFGIKIFEFENKNKMEAPATPQPVVVEGTHSAPAKNPGMVCKDCGKTFPNRSEYQSHRMKEHRKNDGTGNN